MFSALKSLSWISSLGKLTAQKSCNRKLPLGAYETQESSEIEIRLSPHKTLKVLIKVTLSLVSVHLVTQLTQRFTEDFFARDAIAILFDLDAEANIPAAYSASILLFAAVLLGTITFLKKRTRDGYILYWLSLSIVFGFLSLDELIGLHETLNLPSAALLNNLGFENRGLLHFSWVIPAILLVCFCLPMFWRFMMHLPQKARNNFLMAGTLYLGGALGCELLGGYAADVYGKSSIAYLLAFTLEESLEMLGIATFIYGLLSYLKHFMGVTAFKLGTIVSPRL